MYDDPHKKKYLLKGNWLIPSSKQQGITKTKRCKFKGSSMAILDKHKQFFHSNSLMKGEVDQKVKDFEKMFSCSDCDLVFSQEWKLKVEWVHFVPDTDRRDIVPSDIVFQFWDKTSPYILMPIEKNWANGALMSFSYEMPLH